MIDLSRSAAKPKIGEVVNIIPNHCCVVSNMVDEVYGVRDGAVEVVWPVAARGKVRWEGNGTARHFPGDHVNE